MSGVVTLFLGSWALLIGLVVLVVVLVRLGSKQRQDVLQWAVAHGWAVVQRPDVRWSNLLPGGYRHGISVLLHRTIAGRSVCVAEYAHSNHDLINPQGSGQNNRYVVAWVGLAGNCPAVEVERVGRLDWIDRLDPVQWLDERYVGAPRPIPTGYAEFDDRFLVLARDPADVHATVGPALRQAHLAEEVPPWRAAGPDLVTWRPVPFLDPKIVIDLVNGLTRVADLLGR